MLQEEDRSVVGRMDPIKLRCVKYDIEGETLDVEDKEGPISTTVKVVLSLDI